MNKIEQAALFADTLAGLLGEADADCLKDSEEKKMRDKAYTLLINAISKIRSCGKYVNRDDPERAKGYTSEYIASANRCRNKKQAERAEETLPALQKLYHRATRRGDLGTRRDSRVTISDYRVKCMGIRLKCSEFPREMQGYPVVMQKPNYEKRQLKLPFISKFQHLVL